MECDSGLCFFPSGTMRQAEIGSLSKSALSLSGNHRCRPRGHRRS